MGAKLNILATILEKKEAFVSSIVCKMFLSGNAILTTRWSFKQQSSCNIQVLEKHLNKKKKALLQEFHTVAV